VLARPTKALVRLRDGVEAIIPSDGDPPGPSQPGASSAPRSPTSTPRNGASQVAARRGDSDQAEAVQRCRGRSRRTRRRSATCSRAAREKLQAMASRANRDNWPGPGPGESGDAEGRELNSGRAPRRVRSPCRARRGAEARRRRRPTATPRRGVAPSASPPRRRRGRRPEPARAAQLKALGHRLGLPDRGLDRGGTAAAWARPPPHHRARAPGVITLFLLGLPAGRLADPQGAGVHGILREVRTAEDRKAAIEKLEPASEEGRTRRCWRRSFCRRTRGQALAVMEEIEMTR
jgi:hypothetical protein